MQLHRLESLDALRGLAIVWMTAFHFSFDLNHFGYIRQNFYEDPIWTWQRILIVSLFLFCAGLGQSIAVSQGQTWSRFWQRWLQVAACAMLVTLGSWWMYPQNFIYFGVLHGMALMLIVVRLTASWGRLLWLLGAVAIASKFLVTSALSIWAPDHVVVLFNAPLLNWLGWITQKPTTEDYVPVFPWLGVMWWGMAAASRLVLTRPDLLETQMPIICKPLVGLGRCSLTYYMLHQPVIVGILFAIAWLR